MSERAAESPDIPIEVTQAVEAALGYRFERPALLRLGLGALRQPLTPEVAAQRQRLEFLGDAAWNFALAQAVYERLATASPRDLTRLRAAWSSSAGLAQLFRSLDLPAPPGPAETEPSVRVLAEMLEAILGAMVEDGGFEAVRALAVRVVTAEGQADAPPPADAKSQLQMAALARYGRLPIYRLLDRWGPSHQPRFRVQITLPTPAGTLQAEAEGPSRQGAEQEAAAHLLAQLSEP